MNASIGRFGGYRHFNSNRGAFETERHRSRVASVNNVNIDLDALGPDYRISRFVRDPRDLIVSGYHYHRRGAEPWCLEVDPDPEKWLVTSNRPVPSALRPGESVSSCLQRLDQEEGLLAEMELRARHFESMRQWPQDDERIRVWHYENIVGNEREAMSEVAAHYGLPWLLRMKVARNAVRFDASHAMAAKHAHVRDPASGQWRSLFTPRVEAEFNDRYRDLLERYGYDVEARAGAD
jgi:hypothetical protein